MQIIKEYSLQRSLIIVSNRLPVTVGDTITKSSGGLISSMENIQRDRDVKWIGWSGGHPRSASRRREIAEELEQRFNYIPLYFKPDEVQRYYTGFSNSSLWPLLHYLPSYAQYERSWYEEYVRINHRFAEQVAATAAQGTPVWVHDYHLMLLPAILRRMRPDLSIGFFLHTPFPSYEVFRCHPNRRELLEGVLGADLIGFQTTGYLRHFRSTALRLLGVESEINTLMLPSHSVGLGVYPISIPIDKFEQEMQSADYHRYFEEYRRAYAGKKVVLNVERLDYTKGVPRRLDAIARFLAETERNDVVFIFISVPSRENVGAYRDLRRTIELKVSQINGRFASIEAAPLHFIHQSVQFSQLCALYSLADVAMVTPLIDGMNVVAKEYLACRKENTGALILSEFAGAAQELHHAYLVNPYDTDLIAQKLNEALDTSEERQKRRMAPMRERIKRYHAGRWATSFLEDLAATAAEGTRANAVRILDASEIATLLRKKRSTALFLDYDGTLTDLFPNPRDAAPDQALRQFLQQMGNNGTPEIYLLSGRTCAEMERWFGTLPLHLIAENGYYYKHRQAAKWVVAETQADLDWKPLVKDFVQHYADMTPGSFVEDKAVSVVWHYRSAEPEFGDWKARRLMVELYELLANFPVAVHHANKAIEVGSMLVNKGATVQHLRNLNQYERILAAGDDETDEAMFRLAEPEDLTIRVGAAEIDTAAHYRITSPRALRKLLKTAWEQITAAR
jgi:trehalose 6-phosphate synthase/phosphatase